MSASSSSAPTFLARESACTWLESSQLRVGRDELNGRRRDTCCSMSAHCSTAGRYCREAVALASRLTQRTVLLPCNAVDAHSTRVQHLGSVPDWWGTHSGQWCLDGPSTLPRRSTPKEEKKTGPGASSAVLFVLFHAPLPFQLCSGVAEDVQRRGASCCTTGRRSAVGLRPCTLRIC